MTHPYRTPTPVTTTPEYRHGKWMRLRRAYQRLRAKRSRPLTRLRCFSCNHATDPKRWVYPYPTGVCPNIWDCADRRREWKLVKQRAKDEQALHRAASELVLAGGG